jgi:hypothetical protein
MPLTRFQVDDLGQFLTERQIGAAAALNAVPDEEFQADPDAVVAERFQAGEPALAVMGRGVEVEPQLGMPVSYVAVDPVRCFGDSCRSAGATDHYQSWPIGLNDRERLTDFLMSLPSRRVTAMIQFHYLKDVNRDWSINDLRDVLALSTAIPCCDIVVTDKMAWDVTKKRAHLDEEFGTTIFCSLEDLVAHLSL